MATQISQNLMGGLLQYLKKKYWGYWISQRLIKNCRVYKMLFLYLLFLTRLLLHYCSHCWSISLFSVYMGSNESILTGKWNWEACCGLHCWTYCTTRPSYGTCWRYVVFGSALYIILCMPFCVCMYVDIHIHIDWSRSRAA